MLIPPTRCTLINLSTHDLEIKKFTLYTRYISLTHGCNMLGNTYVLKELFH